MCLRCSMTLYQQTAIKTREERQTMKMKLYHEVKRLLSKLALHYLENTATPRERQIQINLLFIDLSMAMPEDRGRLREYLDILKPFLLDVLLKLNRRAK